MSMDAEMDEYDCDDPVQQAAASWFARMRSDDVTERERGTFRQWLTADPQHRVAYERLERVWSVAGTYASSDELNCVMEKEVRRQEAVPRTLQRPGRRNLIAFGLAATLLATVVSGMLLLPRLGEQVYLTGVGESRTVTLGDGSRITLNTSTHVTVDYTSRERRVRLDQGEAYFRVARDTTRPFTVQTERGDVTAVGTEFNVYRQNDRITVTLVEGKVVVGPGKTPVSAGQTLTVTGENDKPLPQEADVTTHTSWLTRRLIFNDEPLASAVYQFNRYSREKIVIVDESIGQQRVTGVFFVDRPQAFVNAVERSFGIRARGAASEPR